MKRVFILFLLVCILAVGSIANFGMTASAEEVEITSKACSLIDYASGTVLYEKNATTHLPIASMVKMMTILLTLDEFDKGNLNEDTLITTTENASGMGGSQVFIDPYVQYTAGDMLKSVIIASGNDASVALAEHISGSEQTFVARMNERAKGLGMNDTHYENCTGLPAPEQYSCAKDCAIVLKEVTGHELYHKYSTIWMDKLIHPSGRITELVNTNKLVKYYEGCDGGKTGSTNEAGCCLSASAKRGNMRLISVIIGAGNSQTRFNECSKLFNYGFANFENRVLLDTATSITNLPVNKGKCDNVEIFPAENYSTVTRKGQTSDYEVTYDTPNKINAPLESGQKIGKATISKNGQLVGEIDLIVKTDIDKLSFTDYIDKIVSAW